VAAEQPGEMTPASRQGDPVWCQPCSAAIATALRATTANLLAVWDEVKNGSPPQREIVSGTKPHPLHPKESLTFLADDIYTILTGWEEDVRDQRRFSERRQRGTRARQSQEAARFLLSHLEWMLGEHPSAEAIVAFGQEIPALDRRIRRATKADDAPLQRCEGVRCPKCLMKALVREQHYDRSLTGYVLCQGCGNLMSGDEYQAHVSREAKGAKKLVRRA
jgi:ribosomal protein L37AE/L43A